MAKRKETLKDDVYFKERSRISKHGWVGELFYGNLTEYAFSKVQKQLKLSRDMKPVCSKDRDHYLNFLFLTSYLLKIRFRYFLFLLHLKEINFSDDLFSRDSFLQILRVFFGKSEKLPATFVLSIYFILLSAKFSHGSKRTRLKSLV